MQKRSPAAPPGHIRGPSVPLREPFLKTLHRLQLFFLNKGLLGGACQGATLKG